MFIEICIISFGLYIADKVNKNTESRAKKTESKEEPDFKEIRKFVRDINETCQNFFQEHIDPLFSDTRDQQLKTLALDNGVSDQEKAVNRDLGIASVNMGVGLVSKVFYPPLLVLTLPSMVWFGAGFYKDAWQQLVENGRVKISMLNSILITWAVMSGYLFAGSVAGFMSSLSQKLILRTKDRSKKKLINAFSQHSRFVWILIEGNEIEIPFEQLQTGDIVVVNVGEIIPADGIITYGNALIGQQELTGESVPSEKGIGDQVFASTMLLSGKIHLMAEKTGKETTAAKIGEIFNLTTDYKTSLESKTEKFSDASILPTIGLSILAYPVVGSGGALAVLFSCVGYNMRIIGPMNTLNFIKAASYKNILVKDGQALEKLCKIDAVVFDKTGTLTLEQPCVNNVHSFNGFSENMILIYAATAEHRQSHPIAKAIRTAAETRNLKLLEIENGAYEIGFGIRVNIAGKTVSVGSVRFMETENISLSGVVVALEKTCGEQGYSLVMVAIDGKLAGAVELHPKTRPEAKEMIRQLRQQKIKTYIISGDHKQPTSALAWELQVDECFAEILPQQKAEILEKLQQEGKTVCFVGDGINDAIALKKADVSVSLRGASTAAIDAAQIVLMNGNLESFTEILHMSQIFERRQKTNLMISVIPNAVCTAGVFMFHAGLYMAMAMYYGGIGLGIGNSTRPLINDEKDYRSKSEFIEK